MNVRDPRRLAESALPAMRSKERLRGTIIGRGALLAAILVVATAHDGWRIHQQLSAANEREVGNRALALSTSTARSVQAVDMMLRDTVARYQGAGRGTGDSDIRQVLAARLVGVAQVSSLAIVDASGRQRHLIRLCCIDSLTSTPSLLHVMSSLDGREKIMGALKVDGGHWSWP